MNTAADQPKRFECALTARTQFKDKNNNMVITSALIDWQANAHFNRFLDNFVWRVCIAMVREGF